MLEVSLGSSDFPSADVAAGALRPIVRRASVQMEAMVYGDPRWTLFFLLEALGSVCLEFHGLMFH